MRRLLLVLLVGLMVVPLPVEGAVTENEWQEDVISIPSPCTGETITVTQRTHIVRRSQTTPDGTTVWGAAVNRVSGIAVSESGQRYVVRGGGNANVIYFPDEGAARVSHQTVRLRLIALGPAEDLSVREVFHLTFTTPGGAPVVEIESSQVFCGNTRIL